MTSSFKVVLLGEGRVGKTSLLLRYVNDKFDDTQKSTIQATYLQKTLRIADRKVKLSIWDTAGQEKFHALGPIYYRNAHGALLVYDVTDMDSFTRVKNWVKELRKIVGKDIVLTLAGNKYDLKGRQVSQEEANNYAKSVNATHIYTSAKANKNVNEAFLDITRRILQSRNQQSSSNSFAEDSSSMPSRKSGVVVMKDSGEDDEQRKKSCC